MQGIATERTQRRLLAVASGGGHWVQLLRLRPAFVGWRAVYVGTFASQASAMTGVRVHLVPEVSRTEKRKLVGVAWAAWKIIRAERPAAIITTGAAPGLVFLAVGRMLGVRTLWVDSIANTETLSASGRVARLLAHRTVSQWRDVAERERVGFWGSVL